MKTRSDSTEFIKQKSFAIIGATQNRAKYGNIAYRNLRAKGYTVFAINPAVAEIEGDRCYPSIASLPAKVDGIVTVVPPNVTEKVVREAAEAGITRVWMQEGSESPEAIQFCQEHGMNVVWDQCIMVVTNYRALMEGDG